MARKKLSDGMKHIKQLIAYSMVVLCFMSLLVFGKVAGDNFLIIFAGCLALFYLIIFYHEYDKDYVN